MSATMTSEAASVMDTVYGNFGEGGLYPETAHAWKPKPYEPDQPRYLWTDAYGVCNYLSLHAETGEPRFLQQATALVEDVHETLGRQRVGGARLPGASDERPTAGGLRIGKADPEGEPDGDGQYFHYLTKWMFALNRMSVVTGERRYNDWALDLAAKSHEAFVYDAPGGMKRMCWKMSIDLQRPLVSSEGNLDPFDGLAMFTLLRDRAAVLGAGAHVLQAELSDLRGMVEAKYRRYMSHDPLDLGEAVWLAHWAPNEKWAQHVGRVSLRMLGELWGLGYFAQPLTQRLAFREFGTTIGVQANPDAGPEWSERVAALHAAWRPRLFARDRDITPVMYATSLAPRAVCRNGLPK